MITFITIFVYSFMAYGLTNIIVFGDGPFDSLFHIRKFMHKLSHSTGKLFDCPMCMSTQLGMLLSFVNWFFIPFAFTPFNILFPNMEWWLIMLFDGFFTSGIVWLLYKVDNYLGND